MNKTTYKVYGILTVLCLILTVFFALAMTNAAGIAANALGIVTLFTGALFSIGAGKLIRDPGAARA